MAESDDALVSQVVLNGSHAAFTELVSRHQASVRSSLSYLTRDPSLAEDLAQDTFIRAFDRISQYHTGRSFKAWLGGIAYNEFLKTMRKSRSTQKKLDAYSDSLVAQDMVFESDSSSIDLEQALEVLSAGEKKAVVLAYGFGMSHSEVAGSMDEPLGTVKTWIQRAKVKMRERLTGPGDCKGDGKSGE